VAKQSIELEFKMELLKKINLRAASVEVIKQFESHPIVS
jgi:hypothetical protein